MSLTNPYKYRAQRWQTGAMSFLLSRALVPSLEVLDEARSTNDVLRARAAEPDGLPDFAVVVTDTQTGGRGRLGRSWVSPPGAGLAISVLLKPAGLSPDALGWYPLLAGLAMSRALAGFVPRPVEVKWPNDVLIDGAKVCGILTELLPGATGTPGMTEGAAVIVGAGVNLTLTADELPTPSATSLVLAGATAPEPDAVLAAYLTELTALARAFLAVGGDPVRSGLRAEVAEACHTLGRPVRVELPGGDTLTGVAVDIDDTGRLIVESDAGRTEVAAGDVTHLRY